MPHTFFFATAKLIFALLSRVSTLIIYIFGAKSLSKPAPLNFIRNHTYYHTYSTLRRRSWLFLPLIYNLARSLDERYREIASSLSSSHRAFFVSIKIHRTVMASIALPVAARFTKFSIDTIYQITRNTVLRSSQPYIASVQQRHNYGTATEEKKAESGEAADLTENERKLKSEIELLNKDLTDIKERNDELNDKYKRALADSENLRVRLCKQIDDAKLFGIQGFCKDLLDVADILGKATESVPKDELTERNPHLKSLYEGLRMTEAQLHKVFKKHGLVSFNPLDEKFDPNQHEALFQQEVQGKQPGTVVVVSKVGYKLHERVVRPALVGVTKA